MMKNCEENKKILVISLARMGDILQTIPLLRALKAKNHFVSILVRSSFADVVESLKCIDEVIVFKTNEIMKKAVSGNIIEYKEKLSDLIKDLNNKKFNEIINLTFSRASAYLSYLIKAGNKLGYTASKDGRLYNDGLWASYFNGTVLNSTVNSINIVDIFQNIAGSYIDPINIRSKIDVNDSNNIENKINKNDYCIAIQLGANTDNKRWPVKSYSDFVKLLGDKIQFSKNNIKIILLGAANEKCLADEFLSNFRECESKIPIVNLIGKTKTKDLWSILEKMKILVTNDTGTMHVAAALDIPIVDISLGPVRFLETGPCSSNSIIISPKISCYPCSFQHTCFHQKCKSYIKPQDIVKAVNTIGQTIYKSLFYLESNVSVDMKESNTANFHCTKKVFIENSPKRFELMPLNKQFLNASIYSEIICNNAITMSLDFSVERVKNIICRVKKYDLSEFNYSIFCDKLNKTFSNIDLLIKKAQKILREIKKYYDENNCKFEDREKITSEFKDKLLDIDMNIALCQNNNEIVHYLLGVFQALKNDNIFDNNLWINRNHEIYNYMQVSMKTLEKINSIVTEELFVKDNKNIIISKKWF